jgi:putative colanic acid biosysnthesis UDP-glucose lipid carrier transferase
MSGKMEPALRPIGEHWLTVDQEWIYDETVDRRGYFRTKRIFDLAVALLVIAGVLSWLMPLLALLIKLDSKGPVFFVQQRMGRASRPFRCYKLRSMVNGRITRLGGWLRRTHLDELPQFFNVLSGAMSLVGPRPYMLSDCCRFAELVPDGDFRHRVKPGITGMAQAKGLHGVGGKDRPDDCWGESVVGRWVIVQRYQWDAYYIRHAGFGLDMRILADTATMLINGGRVR